MMETNSQQDFNLRHSLQPYVGIAVILLGFSIFMLWTFTRRLDSGDLWSILLVLVLFGIGIAFGLSYRIRLQQDSIVQRGFGVKTIAIPISEIKNIKLEVSLGAKRKNNPMVDRPFRRIVITPKTDPDMYIDISLKHFKEEDIRELMRRIRTQRPDLSFPKNWI